MSENGTKSETRSEARERRKPAVFVVPAAAVVAEVQIDNEKVPVLAPSAATFSRVISLWGKRSALEPGDTSAAAAGLDLLVEAAALLVPKLERARISDMPVEALAALVEFLLEEIGRDATSREVALTADPFPGSPSPSPATGGSTPTR